MVGIFCSRFHAQDDLLMYIHYNSCNLSTASTDNVYIHFSPYPWNHLTNINKLRRSFLHSLRTASEADIPFWPSYETLQLLAKHLTRSKTPCATEVMTYQCCRWSYCCRMLCTPHFLSANVEPEPHALSATKLLHDMLYNDLSLPSDQTCSACPLVSQNTNLSYHIYLQAPCSFLFHHIHITTIASQWIHIDTVLQLTMVNWEITWIISTAMVTDKMFFITTCFHHSISSSPFQIITIPLPAMPIQERSCWFTHPQTELHCSSSLPFAICHPPSAIHLHKIYNWHHPYFLLANRMHTMAHSLLSSYDILIHTDHDGLQAIMPPGPLTSYYLNSPRDGIYMLLIHYLTYNMDCSWLIDILPDYSLAHVLLLLLNLHVDLHATIPTVSVWQLTHYIIFLMKLALQIWTAILQSMCAIPPEHLPLWLPSESLSMTLTHVLYASQLWAHSILTFLSCNHKIECTSLTVPTFYSEHTSSTRVNATMLLNNAWNFSFIFPHSSVCLHCQATLSSPTLTKCVLFAWSPPVLFHKIIHTAR